MSEEDSLIGQPIGNYVLKELLGVGGMGAVYLAEHPAIGRQVAIKVLAEHLSLHARLSERFLSEARALALIENPNVIEIYDFGKLDDGRLFYVMELLRGLELGKVMNQRGRLTAAEVLPYLEQICAGLQATHEKGIIHRDLKPENIFVLDRDPMNIKLLDFGIAKLQHQGMGGITLTQTGMVMGTPLYIAPEQASGLVQSIGPQTDLYSLGVILYWMMSGKPPFFNETPALLLAMHISEEVKPIRQVFPSIPAAVAELVEQCLAKKPSDRPASAQELVQRFAEAVDEADAEVAASEASIPGPSVVRALTSIDGEPAVEISSGKEASTTGPKQAAPPADPDCTVEQAAADGAPATSAMPAAGEGNSTLPSADQDPGRVHLTIPVPVNDASDVAATTPVPMELGDNPAAVPGDSDPTQISQPPHQPGFTPPPFEPAEPVGPSSTEITAEIPEARAINEAAQAVLEAPMGHTQVRTTLRGGAGEIQPAEGKSRRSLILAGALAVSLLITGAILMSSMKSGPKPSTPPPAGAALAPPDQGLPLRTTTPPDASVEARTPASVARKKPKKRGPRSTRKPGAPANKSKTGTRPSAPRTTAGFPDPFKPPAKEPARPKAKKPKVEKPKKIGEGTMQF